MSETRSNELYFGDNLPILREHIVDESVDLIYLDPPFNSNANYNILFRDRSGKDSAAQITVFEDTWRWSLESESAYRQVVTHGPSRVSDLLSALRSFLGQNDMMAYLTMMTERLIELHRVLKQTGSIYLHCDPTASHYLKLLLDAVFGVKNFRSEIIWRRTNAHNKTTKKYGPIHDTILFYTKSDKFTFHPGTRPYTRAYIEDRFIHEDERGRFQTNYLTGSETRSGDSGKPWRGFDPTTRNRHWAIPRSLRPFIPNGGEGMTSIQKLDHLFDQGLIVMPKKEGGQPMYKQYIGDGVPYQDIWAYQPNTHGVLYNSDECIDEDVKYLEGEDEKLGYPTQKPVSMLERIVSTSSNKGDVVLDPFCGCGTAVVAAEQLRRQWIGIDVTHLAISHIRHRLHDSFGDDLNAYEVIGEPKDIAGAAALARHDRYQFEWWGVGLVDARPAQDRRKGPDQGVDGYINFFDDNTGKPKRIIVQVKSGKVDRSQIATLKGDMEREKSEIGLFVTLNKPTASMREEAITAGLYEPKHYPGNEYPRVQIMTIQELLDGKRAEFPRFNVESVFDKAPRHRERRGRQPRLR